MKIRDRIKELRRVKASELRPNEKNWRVHGTAQRDALKGLLAEIGYADALLVREVDGSLQILDGHLRAETTPDIEVPVLVLDLNDEEAAKLLATLDPLAGLAEADDQKLGELLAEVKSESGAVSQLLADLAAEHGVDVFEAGAEEAEDPGPQIDRAAELQEKWGVSAGQLWTIGKHRLLCGDSTKREDVERLMGGERAVLVHADPPYGMGKEAEGIINDNLHREKLDAFQMAWWVAARPSVTDNGSAYIWGQAEDLWRLWFGGLRDSERLTFRNEIVWNKGYAQQFAQMTEGNSMLRSYNPTTERCLFFMLGEQGFNNNADNYWEGWEPIRAYLDGEREKCGWNIADTKRIAGHSEKSGCHWFDRSQWMMPTEETYNRWRAAAREHDDLKREWYATRAYFDNTHDNMTDAWDFPRVKGEERHDHPTPKPVDMIRRIVKTSSREGDVVLDPFIGSGTTLAACEKLGRIGYGMEISEAYTAISIQRLADMGLEPKLNA